MMGHCPHGRQSDCIDCIDEHLSFTINELNRVKAQRDWMVDVLVDRWHQTKTAHVTLHEWMEFKDHEYGAWMVDPDKFPDPPEDRDENDA